jgi:hypothetical protein
MFVLGTHFWTVLGLIGVAAVVLALGAGFLLGRTPGSRRSRPH